MVKMKIDDSFLPVDCPLTLSNFAMGTRALTKEKVEIKIDGG